MFASKTIAASPWRRAIFILLNLIRQFARLLPGSLLLYALSAQAATTFTTLSLSAASVAVGQSVTLTATVSGSSLSGTVTFKDGSTTIGTGTVSNGKASLNTTFKTAGSHSLTAVYGGDSKNTSSNSAAKTLTVNKASTTTTLSLSATSIAVDQSVTLAVTISGSTSSGTVTLKDGSTTIGTGTVSSGKASVNTTFKTVGSHSLTAVYGGDANYNSSTSPAAVLTVNKVATTTILSLSATSVAVGQSVTLTVTVAGSSPSGTVTFKDGSTTIGTGTVSSGKASLNTSFNTTGSHSLTVTYGGDANYNSSASAAIALLVNKTATTTTLAVSPNSGVVGQSTTLTAMINSSSATGTVTFKDGTATLGTGTVSSGKASLNISFNTVGSHSLTVVYGGDANYNSSTSTAIAFPVDKTATTTTLTISPNPIAVGQSATLTATINSSSATGTVTFKEGTTTLGIGTVSNGKASFTINFSAAGTYSLTAVYGGDSNGSASTSPAISLKVDAAPTVTLTAPANNSSFLAPATIALTASAADSDGTIAKVEFYNGATLIGTATAAPYTVNWSNIAAGNYTITAKAYDNLGIATPSAAISININAPPTLSLTAPANNSSYPAPAAIALTAAASDSDGTIAKVEFYNGATLLGTATSAPYTFNWSNVAPGKYTLVAKAIDNRGATVTSAAVIVNVNAAPAVNITSPANNAVFNAPGNITITTNAADSDGSITKVEFYNGSTLLSTVTAAPYTFNWNNVAAGQYTLRAVVTDNQGAISSSAPIVINVKAALTVSIIAPGDNNLFLGPTTITLAATATDTSATVTNVEFYNGITLIGAATAAPYNISWRNVAAGTYAVTAKAYNNLGATTTSPAVTINVNAAPTVTMTAPASGSNYPAPATITLSANASDSNGTITKVEFYNGSTLLSRVTTAPYTFNWDNVAAGQYTLRAVATDDQATMSSSASVVVNVNAAPTVALAAPSNNAVFNAPGTITMTANATDKDGSVAKVEFYNGTTLLGTATAAPYTFSWRNVVPGTYTLTAKATDNRGASATSAAVTAVVNAASTIAITAPANNAVFHAPGNITITANAADSDGTVAKVEFYNGNTLLGTATAAPYSFNWSNVAAGSYTLIAKATDNNGAVSTSSMVNVVVNALPTVTVTMPAEQRTYAAPAKVALAATASDGDGSVTKVELFEGGNLLASLSVAPYTYSWNQSTPGNYTFIAKATDNYGATATSAPLAIVVLANQAPTVSITASPATALEPATVELTATAGDADGSVTKVEFYNGTTLLGTATTAPYSYRWRDVVKGRYSVTAKAIDNMGTETTSDPVSVTVTGKGGHAYYIYADHLNTPRQVADQSNQVVWQWNQDDPFGGKVPVANNGFEFNLRFPGQYYDRETNLHFNYFRDYDPQTGRYVQSDPIGLNGGINTYLYGNANPISNIDPTGEFAFAIPAIAAVGEAIGSWALPAAVGTAIAAVMVTPGDTSPSKPRAVPYPDRKRGKYTCICRANKDGRSPDNCSIDNQDFAMGYGEGLTLSEAKRAAEKDAKEKLGAKSTHHIQCRCTAPNGDKVIPHG